MKDTDLSLGKFLFKIVLWLIQLGLGYLLIFILGTSIITNFDVWGASTKANEIITTVFMLCYIGMYFIVIRNLILMVKSTEGSPFIKENVSRFKVMGYCMLINSVLECIIGYKIGANASFQILRIGGKGAFTPPLIVCVIVSVVCFVIADVFKKAIKIKNENELTI